MSKMEVKSLDLCGSIVGLMYKGRRRFKSTLGGVLSVILLIGVFAIIISYLIDFFGRTKSKMTFEDQKYYSPPAIDISNKFSFAIMTQYEGINEIRNDVIKVDAIYRLKNGTQWSYTQIDPVPCEPDKQSSRETFERLELNKGSCFNLSGIILRGSLASEVLQYLQVRIKLCLNEPECLPIEQMVPFFDRTKPVAFLYFVDTAFQTYNTTHRVADYYNYVDQNLTFQNTKQIEMYFSYNEMLVDESYIFPGTPANYSEFMIESQRDKGGLRPTAETSILEYNLLSSNYKSTVHISYMQVMELLASICSLINFLIIAISSLGNYFNHYMFQSDLMNSFYESDIPDESVNIETTRNKITAATPIANPFINPYVKTSTLPPINSRLPHKSTFEIKPMKSNNNMSNSVYHKDLSQISQTPINRTNLPIINTDQSAMIVDSFKQTIERHRQLSRQEYNHCHVIRMLFASLVPCCLTKSAKEHKRKFDQINRSLYFYQDLKNVYRKLMEIDLMKYLLLTEEQLTMYQIVPKPQFRKPHDMKTAGEFASLINNPNFHFLKSKKYIEKALNNPHNRELFVTRISNLGNENKLYEKLLGLITK